MENKVAQLLCVETTLQIEHDVDLIPAHAEREMDVNHYRVALPKLQFDLNVKHVQQNEYLWLDYFENVLVSLPPSLDLLILYGVLLQVVFCEMLRLHTISDVWIRMFDALEHVCWDILLRKFWQPP